MQAAYLTKPKQFAIREFPSQEPKPDEILIRVEYTGVCGSDLHFYESGRIGEVVLSDPFVMGHEFSGIVEDTNGVAGSPPVGTRVAVDPAIVCEQCVFCNDKRYNLCRDLKFTGFPPYPGAFRERIAMPVENVFPIPDSIPKQVGPLLETLAVAVHGLELVPDVKNKTCAVLGAGPVGLLTALVLRVHGANVVLITEPIPERRDKAKELGFVDVFDPVREDVIGRHIKEATDFGPELVFEAAGEPESFQTAFDIVRPAGTICIFGIYPAGSMPLDFTNARRKEVSMIMDRRSLPQNYPTAIDLVAQGKIDLRPLSTHVFPLQEIAEAFELASAKRDGVMKAMIAV